MTTLSPILPATTEVGTVTLLARNLPTLTHFYRSLLGLIVLQDNGTEITLGTTSRPLLTLQAAPDLPAPLPNRPGLYHTAFLQPTRADLGRWLAHAARLGLQIGSGDHLVSEAFYLNDPEGNGIEVYADRPRNTWIWENGQVKMDTLSVDAAAVLREAGIDPSTFSGAPDDYRTSDGLSIGHVHLKVGSAAQAAQFYRETLGLDLVSNFPGAAFMSWGGYHHHVGLNEWHTRGQGKPGTPATGLRSVEFITADLNGLGEHLQGQPGVTTTADAISLQDPWGNHITVRQA